MIALLLAIQFNTYDFSAEQADYDGKTLVLTGHFTISHPMGCLKADQATIDNLQMNRAANEGTQLYLEKNVEIDALSGKNPFLIKATRAVCELPSSSPFSFFPLQEIHFFDQVEIQTVQNLIARGGSAQFKLGTFTLYPTLPTTHCQLIRGNDRILASEIRYELSAKTLHLKGNVLLHSSDIKGKESFATADALQYIVPDQVLLLTAEAPKKVLFWQDGLHLSADSVKICPDPKTAEETVEGVGDVHFTFDFEEQNIIEKFFSNYL